MSSSRTTARSSARAFGHDGGAQVLGDLEDGAHHVLLAVVLADATEEVAVDLDQIGLHLGPQLQVGIAHAVVVQRDAHAVVAQAGEGAAQRGHVLGQRILLGQLDDDAGGFERAIRAAAAAFRRPTASSNGSGRSRTGSGTACPGHVLHGSHGRRRGSWPVPAGDAGPGGGPRQTARRESAAPSPTGRGSGFHGRRCGFGPGR